MEDGVNGELGHLAVFPVPKVFAQEADTAMNLSHMQEDQNAQKKMVLKV